MALPYDDPTCRYIGDGVYATFDGWQVWLHTDRADEGIHTIALEPTVFADLMKYVLGRETCLAIKPIIDAHKHIPGTNS